MMFEGRFSQTERHTDGRQSDSSWRKKWRWFYKVGWLASTEADESFWCKQPSCQVWLTPGNQYLTLPRPTTAFTLIHRFTAKYTLQTAVFLWVYAPPMCWIKASHWIFGGMVTNGNPSFSLYLKRRRKRTMPRCLTHVEEFTSRNIFIHELKIKQKQTAADIIHWNIWVNIAPFDQVLFILLLNYGYFDPVWDTTRSSFTLKLSQTCC